MFKARKGASPSLSISPPPASGLSPAAELKAVSSRRGTPAGGGRNNFLGLSQAGKSGFNPIFPAFPAAARSRSSRVGFWGLFQPGPISTLLSSAWKCHAHSEGQAYRGSPQQVFRGCGAAEEGRESVTEPGSHACACGGSVGKLAGESGLPSGFSLGFRGVW